MPEYKYQWFKWWTEATFTKFLLPEFGRNNGKPPIRYLEIGVWEGASCHWVLTNLNVKAAVAVDPWLPSKKHPAEEVDGIYEKAKANLGQWVKNATLEIFRKTSSDFFRDCFPAAPFDLIYIDGDHTYEAVTADCIGAWDAIVPGGIIVWDDYRKKHLASLGPQAIDEFLDEHKGQWDLFYLSKDQISVRKK